MQSVLNDFCMYLTKHWSVYGSHTNTDTLLSSSSSTAISSAGNSVCMNIILCLNWLPPWLLQVCVFVLPLEIWSLIMMLLDVSTAAASLPIGPLSCLSQAKIFPMFQTIQNPEWLCLGMYYRALWATFWHFCGFLILYVGNGLGNVCVWVIVSFIYFFYTQKLKLALVN